MGLATAFLIGLYVVNEYRTDSGFPDSDRTFRLLRIANMQDDPYLIGVTSGPFGPALEADFPSDVQETIRVMPGNSLVQIDDQRFQEDNYYFADPGFLDFFGFTLLAGNPSTALLEPRSIILTQETAERYFDDPYAAIGKTLHVDNEYDAVVTGVLADIKTPTHLDFDLIESTLGLEGEEWWHEWWNNGLCTYVRLHPGSSEASLEARLPGFMDKYFGEDFVRTGGRMDLDLQPLQSVYFQSDTRYDPMLHGNRKALQIFMIAAWLLVVIASFNHVNMTTAKAVERSMEIGVYKVLGAGRGRIILQMIGESFLLTTISVVIACTIAWYAHPWFETAFDISLDLVFPIWQLVLYLLLAIALLSIMAGLYPGWLLSSFDILSAMKKSAGIGERGVPGVRRVLVVFQFALSVGLIIGTFVIQKQLTYLQNKDLGFDREQVLVMRVNNPELYQQRNAFRSMLEQEPGVKNVTFASGYPGGFHDATTVDFTGISEPVRMRTAFVDFNYVDTYGLKIIAGRNFSSLLASDSSEVLLLNESAVAELDMTQEKVLGMEGRLTMFDNVPRKVVGIVEDFHFTSLHNEIEPLVISTSFGGRNIGIKADGQRLPEVIAAAEEAWSTLAPAYPFQFQFLDDHLNRQYLSERRQGRLIGFFGSVAILIACMGMSGLIAFTAALRAKEIGIRKVLGASVTDIVTLLSRDFLIQVGVAILVATPIAFYLMRRWLEGFAHRTALGPDVFLMAGFAALSIALITVSYQSLKSALSNPVDTLRYE